MKGTEIHEKYDCLDVTIYHVKAKYQRVAKKEYKKNYFQNQYTEEIKRQLNNLMVLEEEYIKPIVYYQFKE